MPPILAKMSVSMKSLHDLLCVFLLFWLVFLCYFSHVAAGADTSISVHGGIKCIDYEKQALLRFKQGIESDYCGVVTSWGDVEDCCQWSGVRCSNDTGHVTMLQLQGDDDKQCLEGTVDSSLFKLKHLEYLDLSSNGLYQLNLESIQFLTNLEHLNLSYLGISGEIPPLGNLSKLVSLDLSNSQGGNYALTAKSLYWLSHLTLLREINLSGVNLSEVTDWAQTLSSLPSLRVLYMDVCELPSIFPSLVSYTNSSTNVRVVSLSSNHFNFNDTSYMFHWLLNLSNNGQELEYLDLSDNSLLGTLPDVFGSMHSLSYLSLDRNDIEGLIPNSFSSLSSLKYLSLVGNSFDGPIPEFMSNLRSLRFLYLSGNNFHGSISKSLKNLCNLQELRLDTNSLVDDLSNVIHALSTGCANKPVLEILSLRMNQLLGSVPGMISSFSSMKSLDLSGNQLNGTLSERIGQLSMLESLDISNNSLEASLNHNHFLNLSRLRDLLLSDNSALVFNIYDDWIPPFQLETISLGSCKLGPYFPKWLLTQTNIFTLDISNAQISGSIPVEFWTKTLSSNIRSLNLSHNQIHGVLPNLSITFEFLIVIDLSSNYFEGSIPPFLVSNSINLHNNMFSDATHLLCRKTQISPRSLDLSNNLLSGELPDCWNHFHLSVGLYLGNNKFSGNIPKSIGTLQELRFLHLENNSFSGELPTSLENCTSLVVLDLSYNSLTGYIPSSIGNAFDYLSVLNLRRNKFFGKLPSSLCKLSYLHVLDLAENHLSGTIPECIDNLTAMTNAADDRATELYNYLGDEEFRAIHQEIATLVWKKAMRSFKNSLMQLVKFIDLSSNELEGKIPNEIVSLTGLISLDLSRNKLLGHIVSNIGQLRSLEVLDLSNNHLSGEIPVSLTHVSTLGTLNLSHNNLSGKIPLGTQLQGFNPASYIENPLLCGSPLGKCPGERSPTTTLNGENLTLEHDNDDMFPGLYISVGLGFIVGFLGVCYTSILKRNWHFSSEKARSKSWFW